MGSITFSNGHQRRYQITTRINESGTQARELRGLSLRELSRCAGLSVTAVSNYERSINLPLVDAVEQLAVALSVSPCWLAYGTGDAPKRDASEAEPPAEA